MTRSVNVAMCDRFQGHESKDSDTYLVSEEVQFANLEKSFREVGLYI